jgi:Flp pilus assembly protein protease CpaA
MSIHFFILLFLAVVLVSLYDLKFRRVPNWVSLPLMLAGIIACFPGTPTLWIGSAFIFQAWKLGMIGGGDAKLWIGLLWCLFPFAEERILLMMSISLLATGLAQMIVRSLSARMLRIGIKTPGVWRTVVFMGYLAYFAPW